MKFIIKQVRWKSRITRFYEMTTVFLLKLSIKLSENANKHVSFSTKVYVKSEEFFDLPPPC